MDNQHFAFLNELPIENISNLLSTETPETIAIVFTHMDTTTAAEILRHLSADLKIEIIIRMSNPKTIPSAYEIEDISRSLKTKMDLQKTLINQNANIRKVAQILNKMGPQAQETLNLISMYDDGLVEDIKDKMFTLEDIIKIEPSGIALIKDNVETEILQKAIKNASQTTQDAFYSIMTEKEKEIFIGDMEHISKLSSRDIDESQGIVLFEAQKLLDNEQIFFEEEE